jgi:homoserine O-acetyltransferase/O-succinyltransferase
MDSALFSENERTSPTTDSRKTVNVGSLLCEVGVQIPSVEVAYETWGTLNEAKDNAILVCHALSGDSHAIGWWDRIVGPGKAIDTDRFFVICSNVLGGCQGTTGPKSTDFPMITIGDMVEVQARLLDFLGVDFLHCVVGGSMGGMQALEWSVRIPDRVKRVFATASAARHSAMQIGLNEVGRQAIMRDPAWNNGNYGSNPPVNGLAVARMLGHVTFLSNEAFEHKFGRRLQGKSEFDRHLDTEFEVESYLNYQGDKFTKRFDANSLLYLTRAIDYYEWSNTQRALCNFLFVSFTSDWLYTTKQSEELKQLALSGSGVVKHIEIDLPYGHDAFLLDSEIQGSALKEFLL